MRLSPPGHRDTPRAGMPPSDGWRWDGSRLNSPARPMRVLHLGKDLDLTVALRGSVPVEELGVWMLTATGPVVPPGASLAHSAAGVRLHVPGASLRGGALGVTTLHVGRAGAPNAVAEFDVARSFGPPTGIWTTQLGRRSIRAPWLSLLESANRLAAGETSIDGAARAICAQFWTGLPDRTGPQLEYPIPPDPKGGRRRLRTFCTVPEAGAPPWEIWDVDQFVLILRRLTGGRRFAASCLDLALGLVSLLSILGVECHTRHLDDKSGDVSRLFTFPGHYRYDCGDQAVPPALGWYTKHRFVRLAGGQCFDPTLRVDPREVLWAESEGDYRRALSAGEELFRTEDGPQGPAPFFPWYRPRATAGDLDPCAGFGDELDGKIRAHAESLRARAIALCQASGGTALGLGGASVGFRRQGQDRLVLLALAWASGDRAVAIEEVVDRSGLERPGLAIESLTATGASPVPVGAVGSVPTLGGGRRATFDGGHWLARATVLGEHDAERFDRAFREFVSEWASRHRPPPVGPAG